jgi:hypothetical protein
LSLKVKEQLISPMKHGKGLLRKALQGGFAQLLGEDMDTNVSTGGCLGFEDE